jgi:hypothetical protein
VGTTALAGALLPWLLSQEPRPDALVVAILSVLALMAGLRCVKPPSRRAWFVPTDAFVLAAVVTLGGRMASAVALLGLAGTASGLAGRLPLTRLLFNAGNVVVATVAASATYLALGQRSVAFAAAAACFFVVNTVLVAAVMALDRSSSWITTWRENFVRAIPHFALAAVLGGALCGLASWGPGWMLALGLLPCLSGTMAESLTSPR